MKHDRRGSEPQVAAAGRRGKPCATVIATSFNTPSSSWRFDRGVKGVRQVEPSQQTDSHIQVMLYSAMSSPAMRSAACRHSLSSSLRLSASPLFLPLCAPAPCAVPPSHCAPLRCPLVALAGARRTGGGPSISSAQVRGQGRAHVWRMVGWVGGWVDAFVFSVRMRLLGK